MTATASQLNPITIALVNPRNVLPSQQIKNPSVQNDVKEGTGLGTASLSMTSQIDDNKNTQKRLAIEASIAATASFARRNEIGESSALPVGTDFSYAGHRPLPARRNQVLYSCIVVCGV
jgi:hypothetical protein